MRTTTHRKLLATSLALLLAGVATTAWATAADTAADIGPTNAAQKINVTLVLKLHNQPALESYIAGTVTPGSPLFHHFLTTAQFAHSFGATDQEIAQVRTYLQSRGIATGNVLPSHMSIQATGTVAQFSALFQTKVHDYVSKTGQHFHRPASRPVLPAALAGTVLAPAGLNNQPRYVSHRHNLAHLPASAFGPIVKAMPQVANGNITATGQPGNFTVGDVANLYNINPLYNAGIQGQGTTIGIVTLADFVQTDATDYWDMIGLVTKPDRITRVRVDGGGTLSANAGSGETTLDVQQSGGLAPFADIRVYDAPNTTNGFIDAFFTAVSDNVAESLSVSWGSPEIYDYPQLNGGDDYTFELQAFHQAFMEAAVQGISMFAASGDSGAYDTVRGLGHTDFTAPLTVDAPASDPYITAAGGTTVPIRFRSGFAITQESVWGWDYLQALLDASCPGCYDVFGVGGGGGVSVYWRKPSYQWTTRGIKTSEPNQALTELDLATPYTYLQLPGHFAGRNVPDVSLNADPESGYMTYSTTEGGLGNGSGGTSFVAPQLNGISALLTQSLRQENNDPQMRMGFWNPQLYALQSHFGYGSYTAFKEIRGGNNWFYAGQAGYEPGAGLGALNVANLNIMLGGTSTP